MIERLHVVSWRDLEHPYAGGSERHVHELMKRWAASGVDVTLRTGSVPSQPAEAFRGYKVIREGGRFTVFLRHAVAARARNAQRPDALFEVWHGVPLFAAAWSPVPVVSFAHHVHGDQFDVVLPRPLASIGHFVERRVAPRLYRTTPLVTLSESGKRGLVDELGYDERQVTVVPPGVDTIFSPAGDRDPRPLVLAVARFVPQKRVAELVDVLREVKASCPQLRAVIVGDGPERRAVEERASGADWIVLAGTVSDAELLRLYRSAWVLVSASRKEGWGMTITEAAACGTPSVVTRISGHVDAVVDGASGVLASNDAELTAGMVRLLNDDELRARLSKGAVERASQLSWDAAATSILDVLTAAAATAASRR